MTYLELKRKLENMSMDQLSVDVMSFDGENFVKCDDIVLSDDLGYNHDDEILKPLGDYITYPILLQTWNCGNNY